MKIEFKDVAKFYLGCKVKVVKNNVSDPNKQQFAEEGSIVKLDPVTLMVINQKYLEVKPILRPLSNMTEKEAEELCFIFLNDPEQTTDQISKEEIQTSIIKETELWSDIFAPKKVGVLIDISCRCFEGCLIILTDGSFNLFDENENTQMSANHAATFLYLLSKGFDLFNLIENDFAIDATALNK